MDSIQNYLDFLAYCLDTNRPVPECIKSIVWHNLFEFAKKQTIIGIYAYVILNKDGNLDLQDYGDNKPTDEDVMEWMGALMQIQRANERINAYCVKTQTLFKKAGYDCCILKGQGNTLNYPSPYIRNTGDIDIWVDRKRWDIFRFVRKYFPNAEFKCQHIEFPVWKQVPVEVHFYPMYLENFWANRDLQQFFKINKIAQFSNLQELPGNVGKICIPTPFFNAVYQLTHINVHLLIEGIGLRQFIDY